MKNDRVVEYMEARHYLVSMIMAFRCGARPSAVVAMTVGELKGAEMEVVDKLKVYTASVKEHKTALN